MRITNSGAVLAGPDIVSRGFVYVREAEALLNESKNIAADAVQEALEDGRVDYVRIRTEVRERLGSFLWREMKRHPVILPVIMEVEV